MTVTRLPPPLSTSPRADPFLSAAIPATPSYLHPPRSATTPSQLPSPSQSRPSVQLPARSLTSPTTPQGVGMRPVMNAGPSSHLGHSSNPQAVTMTAQQFKSYSAHGHGSSPHQASYFTQSGSAVSSEATTPRPSMALPRANRLGYQNEADLPLISPNPPFAVGGSSASRPSSPRSVNSHSDDTHPTPRSRNETSNSNVSQSYGQSSKTSNQSYVSPASASNSNSNGWASSNTSLASAPAAPCSACQQPMSGQFVRALGTVFHLDCFRCGDCNAVVASKFFPIEGQDGKQQPLCERDYFRRLNLICGQCEQALRGSYITACNKKFHVEHFTCSVCPTLFGPQDSYYEHNGDVYCHFHYSTRFATKCVGCSSAILKQFVEINRNMKDECWHPECYMIHKFWNVKVASRATSSPPPPESEAYAREEAEFDAVTLKEKQAKMETLVTRIWTHLSAFEESSAACISDMLRHVSNGMYLEAIRMAEKFILHVEVLFAAIDELEGGFATLGVKGMSHVREARMLCRKTVDLFTLLSHTQDQSSSSGSAANNQRMGMTQELLALVTGLAHYLKILIRIALTGALKLERDYSDSKALLKFLDRLQFLALEGADPSAKRLQNSTAAKVAKVAKVKAEPTSLSSQLTTTNETTVDYSQGVAYGYRSLGPECAGESPFSAKAIAQAAMQGTASVRSPPSDLCAGCKLTVEEDCVRLGTYQRWHSHCVKCVSCGKLAAVPTPTPSKIDDRNGSAPETGANGSSGKPSKITSARRPPANVGEFRYEMIQSEPPAPGEKPSSSPKVLIFCTTHASSNSRSGFSAVSRLEQYAFLLNVALRRLYLLLHKRGVMPLVSAPPPASKGDSPTNSYRDSADILRMKSSVHLDRKLSATAQLPRRSTIIESPTGKIAQPTGSLSHHPHLHAADTSLQRPAHASTFNTAPKMMPLGTGGRGVYAPPRPAPPNIPPLNQHDPFTSPVSPNTFVAGQDAHAIRPSFARNNSQVLVVDEKLPEYNLDQRSQGSHAEFNGTKGAVGTYAPEQDSPIDATAAFGEDTSLTLADIPQLLESEQAREQHRSLPREAGKPLLAELTPLELVIVKHFAVLALLRSPLRDQFELDDLLELIEVKKNTFWNKLFKGNDKKNKKKTGTFGVPLEVIAEQGTDSMLGSSMASLRVPIFIDDVISAMKQMDLSVEGIFRKNGNIRRLRELTEAIDRDPASVDLTQENPVQLAALLKKFLRDLPDPLMTFKLHRLWNAVATLPLEEDRKRYLHILSIILPKSHRDTLEALFVFLKWVASFSHVDEETGSKMDLQNLATVICPSILYAKGREAAREDSFTAIPVVTELLEGQDEFYVVPNEFLAILHDQEYFASCIDMPCKDVLKKVDTYLRVKQSGRSPVPQNGYALQASGSNAGFGRNDGNDVRLIPQRSDPAISRGRAPNGDGLRSPQPVRMPNPSRSKERKQSDKSDHPARLPTHAPPQLHHAMSSPGPPSPRQGKPEAPRPNNQPGAPYVPPGNWATPGAGSRPSSWARPPNGEQFPPGNGRQSPGGRF